MKKYLALTTLGAALTAGTAQADGLSVVDQYCFKMVESIQGAEKVNSIFKNDRVQSETQVGYESKITCESSNDLKIGLQNVIESTRKYVGSLAYRVSKEDVAGVMKVQSDFELIANEAISNINYFRAREGCDSLSPSYEVTPSVEPTEGTYQTPTTKPTSTEFVPSQDQKLMESYSSQLRDIQGRLNSLEEGEQSLIDAGVIQETYSLDELMDDEEPVDQLELLLGN